MQHINTAIKKLACFSDLYWFFQQYLTHFPSYTVMANCKGSLIWTDCSLEIFDIQAVLSNFAWTLKSHDMSVKKCPLSRPVWLCWGILHILLRDLRMHTLTPLISIQDQVNPRCNMTEITPPAEIGTCITIIHLCLSVNTMLIAVASDWRTG